jgi:hypothetical protein
VRDRSWFSGGAATAWFLAVSALFFGGYIGWAVLGGMCEDYGAAGSDSFCTHGGLELAVLVFACALNFALAATYGQG